MTKIRTALFKTATVGVCASGLVFAPASHAVDFGGLIKLGYDWGGEKLVSATLISGSTTSHEAIYANSGLVLAGGMTLLNRARNFSMDATIGWKSDSIDASNQSFEFKRVPLDVLGFYNLQVGEHRTTRLRFGGGLTYHVNPTFKASGALANGTVNFDDALGYVAQFDAVMASGRDYSGGINFGVRFTGIQYKTGSTSIQGNGLGLFFGGMF